MSKPGKSLKGLCKKLGVRLTLKKGKKRVYKSIKVLKEQCKRKVIKKKKVKKKKVKKKKVRKRKVRKRRKFGMSPGIRSQKEYDRLDRLINFEKSRPMRKYLIEHKKNQQVAAGYKDWPPLPGTRSSHVLAGRKKWKIVGTNNNKCVPCTDRGEDENCLFSSKQDCKNYIKNGPECKIMLSKFAPSDTIMTCWDCGQSMSEVAVHEIMNNRKQCPFCRKELETFPVKAKRYYDLTKVSGDDKNQRISFREKDDAVKIFKDEYGEFEEDIFGKRKEGPFKDMQKRAKRQDFLQFKLNSKEHLEYEEKIKQKELKKEYNKWKKFVEDNIQKLKEKALKARDERAKKRRIEKAQTHGYALTNKKFGKRKRKRKMKRKRKPVKRKRKPLKKKRKPVKKKRKPVKKKRKPVKKKRKPVKKKRKPVKKKRKPVKKKRKIIKRK